MSNAYRDENSVPTLIASSNVDGFTPVRLYADPVTHRLLVDIPGGSGTVTSVSVVSANGFAGSVATATTTPAITLSTTITGVLKGNGTAISAAAAGTDYQAPITLTTTGTSGAATFIGNTLNVPNYATSAGITVGTTTITSGTTTRVLFDNAGVLGEYVISGSGNVAMTTSPTFVTPILGTPTSGTLTNTTGFPVANLAGAGTGVLTFLATPSSANLAAAITDETGSGALVFATSPSFTTPTIGGVAIPSISSTNTLSNKRITRRLVTVNAPGATPTTNTDNTDIANFTGVAAAITSMTTSLSGTPVDGDLIEFRFTDNGTARAITWGASFGATTVALPTTTVISTMLRALFEWNGSIWQCIAVA